MSVTVAVNTLDGGHNSSVLCCATTSEGKILSGGENGELCLWSADGQSHIQSHVQSEGDVTCICCANTKNYVVFVSADESVLEYDIRQFNQAVHQYEYNEEEVNHIAINEKDEYLASCDDSGQVKVIKLQDRCLFKTLRKHSNICASVSFRSRRPWDLISGGYDKQLIQWDFSRGRSLCVIDMESIGSAVNVDSYVVNPPFIHSLNTSFSGKYLACGTENALIQVFSASKRTPEYMTTLRGHSQGVSQVHFPHFSDTESLLVSGGNDGKCLLWNLDGMQPALVNGHASSADVSDQSASTSSHSSSNSSAESTTSPLKMNIDHGEKINWINSGETANQRFLVLADNTNILSLYPLPQL